MTFPIQKTFGDFTRERFGSNWVFAHRATDRLRARYDKNDCPVVVITPKQQKELAANYKREWGAAYNEPQWKALCALRAAKHDYQGFDNSTRIIIEKAIEALTS